MLPMAMRMHDWTMAFTGQLACIHWLWLMQICTQTLRDSPRVFVSVIVEIEAERSSTWTPPLWGF